jgi:ribosomal-protein-alanine N-acetyltransferase
MPSKRGAKADFAMVVAIETERLILRPFAENDRDDFAALNAEPVAMEFLLGVQSREKSDVIADKFLHHWEQHGFGMFSIIPRDGKRFAGFIGLKVLASDLPRAPGVEIAWTLDARYWGRGLASEGAKAILAFGRDQLNLVEIVALTATINHRSQRVMEKIGMVRDPAGDFDHPRVPAGHQLQRHVVYRFGHKE